MMKEIKEKLENIVALLNDPEETVLEKEIKEKLEKIVALLNDPKENDTGKDKLKKIVSLVNNVTVDPDIDIDFCIPGVETTVETCDKSGDPYILVTYVVSEYNKPTRKIHLGSTTLQNTAQEVTNQVTFSIEEFKSEIDSVQMG